MTEPVISVKDLSRAYGEVVALNEVSFDVTGGVVGLLGPNGAGKSTLLKILTGELRPSLGTVRVLGMDPWANADLYFRIGICPEDDAIFEDLTGREFVAFLLRLRGVDPEQSGRLAEEWLDRFGLADAMNRRIRGYSKGMRQRTKLAFALAHDPELLFLDEPLTDSTRCGGTTCRRRCAKRRRGARRSSSARTCSTRSRRRRGRC